VPRRSVLQVITRNFGAHGLRSSLRCTVRVNLAKRAAAIIQEFLHSVGGFPELQSYQGSKYGWPGFCASARWAV